MARRVLSFALSLTVFLVLWPVAGSAQSTIAITAPAAGAVVPLDLVPVSGTATAVPDGNIVVQALTADGTLLAEASVTVAEAAAGTSAWQINLQLQPVAPGTLGRLYAFSRAPQGGLAAETAIDVAYGQAAAPAPTPAISIEQPQPGATVDSAAVTVSGQGTALPDNTLMVEGQDANGVVLVQQVATASAPPGGTGPWQATLSVPAAPGSPGRIVAYSVSPTDGSRVAEAAVDIIYSQPAPPPSQPSLVILSPSPGSTISEGSVDVAGSGAALPDNNVVVQALDANGALLAEQSATVDGPVGGSGPWRALLTYQAQPGSPGRIYAFARSPADGSLIAESAVDVVYGVAPVAPIEAAQPAPTPEVLPERTGSLVILRPLNGAVLFTDQPIAVTGRADPAAVGEISVRMLAPNGAILAETRATADATGSWATALPVERVNTPATVYAFSRSPVDGSIQGDDAVFVTLATPASAEPEPLPPSIVISTPVDGAQVDIVGGFVVGGTARGAYGDKVLVRVRDAYGRSLRQVATAADEDGNWSVTVRLRVANGTPGSIYAYSVSPADGATVVDDLVRVTFASRCEPRTDWPVYVVQPGDTLYSIAQATGTSVLELLTANCLNNPNELPTGQRIFVPQLPAATATLSTTAEVTIQSPASGATIELASPLVVAGASSGSAPGSVFVRILDNAGAVVGETRAAVATEADAAGVWTWQAQFDASTLPPGSRGTVFAHVPAATDGRILAAAASNVVFGAADRPQPFVTIESPLPYAEAGADGNVLVVGRGAGLWEGNVVVQLLDTFGNVRAQVPTTVASDQIGGEGEWRIVLPLIYVGRGKVSAFSTSPVDGSILASATRDVVFGDLGEQPSAVLVTFPLPGTIVTGESPITALAGYARGIDSDSVQVMIFGQNNRLLHWLPASVDRATGFWSLITAEPLNIQGEQELLVQVVALDALYGTVLAEDRLQLRLVQPRIAGTVSSLDQVTLPPVAVLSVSVQNTSIADAPPEVTQLGRQVIVNPGQMPIQFAVPYNPADVDPNATYGITARIEDSVGNLLYINTQSVPVLTQGNPVADVAVVVEPVP